jgi:hypothetical protein
MAFLTISLCAQLTETDGNDSGLSEPSERVVDSRRFAPVCDRSAP